MYYIKNEQFKVYKTSMSLASYRDLTRKKNNLYVKDTDDGIEVEWQLKWSRGAYLIAYCRFAEGNNGNNTVEVRAKIKHANFYKIMLGIWIVLGGMWILFEPSASTIQSYIFGLLVIISFWSFLVANRNALIKTLSPT